MSAPLAAAKPAAPAQSNTRFADIGAFLKVAKALGEAEAKGGLSRPAFLVDCAIAASEGLLNDTQKGQKGDETDAHKAWESFRKGQAKLVDGVLADPAFTDKDFKQKRSVVSSVIRAGRLCHGFGDMLDTMRPIIAEMKSSGSSKLTTFDAFYALSRTQAKLAESLNKGGQGDCRPLTEAEVRAAIATPESIDATKTKDEATMIETIIKSLTSLVDGVKTSETHPGRTPYPSSEAQEAIKQLRNRLAIIAFHKAQAALPTK